MKFLSKDILKDIGISFLIVIAIILLIMIVFYNKISIGRVIPKAEEYTLSEELANELEQESEDEDSEIIKTYELEASDLKKYEKTNEYNKGKKNPFSAESSATTNSTTGNNTTSSTNEQNDTVENTSSSTNFYDDDGTK